MARMECRLTAKHINVLGEGVFTVASESEEGKSYKLSFGMENRLPSCECQDWRRHKLPCKHFCAIFKYIPGWTWQQLSPSYRDLPLLKLDTEHLVTGNESVDRSEPVPCEPFPSEPVPCEGEFTDNLDYCMCNCVLDF